MDDVTRCAWTGSEPVYLRYHDEEWGVPVVDDRRLFEKLCLEGFQAGLSWLTILRKRDAFRAAFAGFDPEAIAAFGPADVRRLLGDAGIVRNRAKIEATINNAQRVLELQDGGGSLAAYAWGFEGQPEAAAAMSKDLKRRGWAFVGPTTVYSFMQAMGLVNDHDEGCARRPVIDALRAALARPR